jgi:metal transporter CNNM
MRSLRILIMMLSVTHIIAKTWGLRRFLYPKPTNRVVEVPKVNNALENAHPIHARVTVKDEVPDSTPSDSSSGETMEVGSTSWTINIVGAVSCVSMAALAAGLTMGMVNLDKRQLAYMKVSGSEAEKLYAAAILPLLQDHHKLLVTLLLLNSLANEALPLFLDSLVPTTIAIIISVTAVLMFGEVLPSAIFTGPSGLRLVASLTRFVRFWMFVLAPLAWPIAKLLDKLVPHEQERLLGRGEVKAFIESQVAPKDLKNAGCDIISIDEMTLIEGVLALKGVCISEVLIPLDSVIMLDINVTLDRQIIGSLLASRKKRFPVFDGNRNNICGIVMPLDFLRNEMKGLRKIAEFTMRRPLVVKPSTTLLGAFIFYCSVLLIKFMHKPNIIYVYRDAEFISMRF